MTSVVQYGRRRGSSKSAEEANRIILPPDLREVTVLNRSEWLRIQDSLNKVNKEKERMIEAVKQREALHLQSKEVVKSWSSTIAGQRQKKLEAKKIREETEEEKRKLIDVEEANFKKQKHTEDIEKAKTQLYYQTDRVKKFHRALMLTEVLKEREAQIELKQMKKHAAKDVEEAFMDILKTRRDEALRQEQEKARQRKRDRQTLASDQKTQIKRNEQMRERQKTETKKDREEIQHLHELYQLEQRMEEERQAEQKKNLMKAHLEHVNIKDLIKAADAQKLNAEEERRKCALEGKQKMAMLRKEKEIELIREAESRREKVINKLKVEQRVEQREKTLNEEQRFAKAVAEKDAQQAQWQREKEEKWAAMLKSIDAHRQLTRQEKEQMNKTEQQNKRDILQANKEADRIFSEKKQLEAQTARDEEKKLQDFNYALMNEKIAKNQQMRRDKYNFGVKNIQFLAEEENQFLQYSHKIITAAAEAQRNVFPLCKATKDGIGGGLGPVISGVRPSYLVHDSSATQIPKYVSGATQQN